MTTPAEGRGAIVRPTLCGLLILLSALPFAVVAPRLKAEYDHMRRSEAVVSPQAVPVASIEDDSGPQGPQITAVLLRKELSR